MTVKLARVIATHPGSRTVDLVFLDTGMPVARVQVATPDASSDSGGWSVPDVPKPTKGRSGDQLDPGGRNLIALVASDGRRSVVIGFLPPAGGQMTFKEQNRQVHRHPSGAYTTIAPDGSIETYHPSGAYLRIGSGAHQDLNEVSADGNWTIPAGAPPARITLATAGFTLTVKPGGETELVSAGKVTMTYAEMELNGDVTLNGTLTASVDVVADGVSLKQHKHGGVQSGAAQTSKPA